MLPIIVVAILDVVSVGAVYLYLIGGQDHIILLLAGVVEGIKLLLLLLLCLHLLLLCYLFIIPCLQALLMCF